MARVQMSANAAEEAGSYEPIPDGEYILSVAKVEDKTSKSGRPQAILEMVVDEGPYIGRKLWYQLTFIPKGEPGHGFTVQALHAFGFEHDGNLDFDTADFVNRTCRAKVTSEPYVDKNGKNKKKNVIATAGFITDKSTKTAAAEPAKGGATEPAKPATTPSKPAAAASGGVPF